MNAIRLSFFAAVVAFGAVALAGEPSAADEHTRRADVRVADDAAFEPLPLGVGLRVFIDPETGQFRRPTTREVSALAENERASKNKSIEGLEVEYRADGSKHVDLQGRFMHSLRVSVGEDGSMSYTCTDREHDHAKPAAAPAAPADR
jgi:hypothetical protein